ncbi:diguanylate cyclase domain-containing protein [Okeania sp. SIO1I7]|uniref:diguanylate cyclase domain-containing protein n=1 Tax=Okeania sp. SIO1I7 TaxID=2607772 RepID=UPI0013FB95E7|nr:diguanylate cyclase [Okeania sp. SIO1I7]NET25037.1 diguanylate cyclase [Okeania sp. SIO1I7]
MNQEILVGNILIVDDQINNLRVLTTILKGKNYTVRKAIDGETAIEAAQIEPPNLIILDIKMPGMDGYEVCKHLKSNQKTQDIPIIFISALSEVFDKVKAFEVGGIDYITKPFQEEEVLARINSQLTIQKQQKLLQQEKALLKQEQEKLKQEIQQRKEAEAILYQSRALISSILRSSLDGVAALEAVRNPNTAEIEDFRCLEVNPIIAEVFNQERENLIGKLIFRRFINKIDPNLFAAFVGVVETGISLQKDFNYKYKEEQKWYSCIAVKLADGFAVTVRDITERKTLELELNRLATIDGLTGVYNRSTFDQTIVQEWQRAQREKQPLSLILFDADYFKLYNDYYGHQAGDNCLVQIAHAASETVKRPGDFVARYGGEEFVIILPNTDRQGAIAVAEGIRQAIQLLAIPHERSEVSSVVSVSMGIACVIPTTDSSPETLISMADQAMYKAKQQGRNLAIVYMT